MVSEGRLCSLAEGVYSADDTVKCLKVITTMASLFYKLAISRIFAREMEVQI